MKKMCLMLATCFLLTACQQETNTYQAPPPPKVTVVNPVQKDVTDYAYYTGTSAAYQDVNLQAQVSGYLQKINFTPGDIVKKGDLLLIIDPAPYKAKLDEAKANLAVQRAELKLAEATLKRKSNAYKHHAVSEVEIIEAKAQKAEAEASVQAARATVQAAQVNLDYTQIHAPTEGRISRNLVDIGNLVTTSTLLANIVDYDPIYVYFNVSENDLLKFISISKQANASDLNPEDDYPAQLSLENEDDYPHQGQIDYAANSVDSSTGTIQVRAVFPNPKRDIIPGLFCQLRLPIQTRKGALLVPDVALGSDQRGSYVLTVNQDNSVQYKLVKPGAEVGGQRVILSGLQKNDQVITNGIQQARPGSKVTPQPAATGGEAK